MSNTTESKPFWKGTNFYVFVLALFGGLIGWKLGDAQSFVSSAIALGSAIFAVRSFFTNGGVVNVRAWALDKNTWAYVGSILALFFVDSPDQAKQLGETAGQAVNAAASGNYTLLIQTGLSLFTLLWHLLKPKA